MNLRTLLLLACVATGVAGSGGAADMGTIMPLGDSITLGVPVNGGYRAPLMDRLAKAGHSFRFVGSQNGFATTNLTAAAQQQHEGHSGFIIDGRKIGTNAAPRTGLYENMGRWLAKEDPANILLMIGSNDINLDYRPADTPERLSALISLISNTTNGLRPKARLYVASIVPMNTPAGAEQRVLAFNARIPGIVAAHRANGENVVFVNMHDALTFADLADKLHPNAAGYDKMAGAWFAALTGTSTTP